MTYSLCPNGRFLSSAYAGETTQVTLDLRAVVTASRDWLYAGRERLESTRVSMTNGAVVVVPVDYESFVSLWTGSRE